MDSRQQAEPTTESHEKARQRDLTGVEDRTESEEYSWAVGLCIETNEPLYFVEDSTLRGFVSEQPIFPDLSGFAYPTTPSFSPDKFIPGRKELFGQPVTAIIPSGTQLAFDQVFVAYRRFNNPTWHFVAPVLLEDGTTQRVDFTHLMGRAARHSDYGTPLERMIEGLEFLENKLSFCEGSPVGR